jgi:hypothetical protein
MTTESFIVDTPRNYWLFVYADYSSSLYHIIRPRVWLIIAQSPDIETHANKVAESSRHASLARGSKITETETHTFEREANMDRPGYEFLNLNRID